jgi:hypothetical protein
MFTPLPISFLLGGSIVLPAKAVESSRVDQIPIAVVACTKIPPPNIPQDGVAMQSHPLGCLCSREKA